VARGETEEPSAGEETGEGAEPPSGQPGLGALRAAVAVAARRFRTPARPGREALAGLNVAIANVPDGLANGLLVGANPVYGLYATMAGPLVGGALASTRLMVVSTTAAASLTAAQALSTLPAGSREDGLFLMVVLAGAIQVAAGLLGLDRLTRFVSYSVTTGFLTGIAASLVLSQLPTITGVEASGGNRVAQALSVLARAAEAVPWSVGLAALALLLAVLLPRTPVGSAGRLLAVIVPSLLLVLLDLQGVRAVGDVGEIPRSVPSPAIPRLAAAFDVLTGALSLAVVILVQGAGVSQSVPNPDGSRSRGSRDFVAQGAANLVSGLFRGLPVGGSASTTALNVLSGARTRWAAMFAGAWMAAIVVGVPGLVGYVAMPALGALLVLAGVSSVKPSEIASVWRSGWGARLAGGATFAATLTLPIQAAVGIGVVLSALLFLRESSAAVRVVQVVELPDGRLEERAPPATLEGRQVTVLDVYGDLFYAGARTLEELLPRPRGARDAAVVLRLRGQTAAGATLVDVLSHYAEELRRVNGRLYLTGIRSDAYDRLARAAKLRLAGRVRVYEATPILGESTRRAVADARAWLARLERRDSGGTDDG
jgi:sulfate permease, SulP family